MNEEEEKPKTLYDGDIKGRVKIKINDFTFFCRPDREEKAKKKYAKYFKKKFIKY